MVLASPIRTLVFQMKIYPISFHREDIMNTKPDMPPEEYEALNAALAEAVRDLDTPPADNDNQIKTPIKAIRAKCLDCTCGHPAEVRNCTIKSCPLYPYRMGHRPKKNPENTMNTGETPADK